MVDTSFWFIYEESEPIVVRFVIFYFKLNYSSDSDISYSVILLYLPLSVYELVLLFKKLAAKRSWYED